MIRFLCVMAMVVPVAAQEYIITDGPLSDTDFYRLVSCAAPPGQDCREPVIKWNNAVVTAALAPVPRTYPADLARQMDKAFDHAILQINAAAPGLTLRRVPKSGQADVRIYLQFIRAGEAIRGTGIAEMDGTPIGAAQVNVFWDGNRNLTEAAIVFAADIPLDQAQPIMIEELTQAMGLMTDIRNPYYETRSVFSEDSNSVAKLGAQDRVALRLHYPSR